MQGIVLLIQFPLEKPHSQNTSSNSRNKKKKMGFCKKTFITTYLQSFGENCI